MTAAEIVRPAQNLTLTTFDQDAVLKHLGLNPRDAGTQALMLVCQKYDLDPILKHALLIQGRLYVTRDGLLHVAHRSGVFDGMEVVEQGESQTHFTAKVSAYRKDMSRPFTYIGRHPKSSRMAKEYGPEMAVKVAEVMALRRAFDVAICAAEERWDEEAQKELGQEAKPAPQPTAPRSPRADVTERVRQELEQQQPTAPSDALRAEIVALWKEAAPHIDQTAYATKYGQWRTDASQAAALRQDLKRVLANVPAPEVAPAAEPATEQPAQAEPEVQDVPVVELATAQQRSTLSQHATRAGANDSAGRAALWAYLLNQDKSIGTKELTAEQAAVLIDTMTGWSNDEAQQAFAEARKAVLPF